MDKADDQTSNRQVAKGDQPTGYPTMHCVGAKGAVKV